jgi:hypothetical protein
VSPRVFAIYLSNLFKFVEEEVLGVRPLSFVDDTSSTARGNSVREKLQKASETAIEWGRGNDVQFDAAKTEALLFMRKRGRELREQRRARIIVCMIGEKEVEFAQEATRCLGVWLDSGEDTPPNETRKGSESEGKNQECRRENPSDSDTSSVFLQSCQYTYWSDPTSN